jgi:hypothetical protein
MLQIILYSTDTLFSFIMIPIFKISVEFWRCQFVFVTGVYTIKLRNCAWADTTLFIKTLMLHKKRQIWKYVASIYMFLKNVLHDTNKYIILSWSWVYSASNAVCDGGITYWDQTSKGEESRFCTYKQGHI